MSKDVAEIKSIKAAAGLARECVEHVHRQCTWLYELGEEVTAEYLADELRQRCLRRKPGFELSYNPIIDSGGGSGGLKPRDPVIARQIAAASTALGLDGCLRFGSVVVSVGIKHAGLHGNFARTILFNPSAAILQTYDLLQRVRKRVIEALVPGAIASDVYCIAVDMIRRERPQLLPNFAKTVGHSIGFRFKESVVLGERCFVKLGAGEVYNVQLGFAGLAASAHKARPSKSPAVTECLAAGDDGDDAAAAAAAAETVTIVLSDSVVVTEGPRGLVSTSLLKSCVVKQRKYVPSSRLLPLEIMVDIFALLDPLSLGRASCVCRSWRIVGWTHVDFQPVLDRVKWSRQTGFTDRVVQKFAGGKNGGSGHRFIHNAAPAPPKSMMQLSSRPLDVLGTFTQLRHSNITFLSLAECSRIREHELRALRTMPRLQSLNLNFTGIGGKDPIPACRQLAAHLATPTCALRRLEGAGPAIHGAGLSVLLKGLETNTSLVFLRLQENPIGDSGAFALARFVAATTTVKRIPLGPMGNVGLLSRGTRIGQTGLDALAVALAGNDSIPSHALTAPAHHGRKMMAAARMGPTKNRAMLPPAQPPVNINHVQPRQNWNKAAEPAAMAPQPDDLGAFFAPGDDGDGEPVQAWGSDDDSSAGNVGVAAAAAAAFDEVFPTAAGGPAADDDTVDPAVLTTAAAAPTGDKDMEDALSALAEVW